MQLSYFKRSLAVVMLLTVAVTSGLWLSCSDQANMPNEPVKVDTPVKFNVMNPDVQKVISIQDRHTDLLFTHPEVVGTGTGLNEAGELVVVVYTASAVDQIPVDLESLMNEAALNAIPETVENIPLVAKKTGSFKIFADPTARYPRPVPIGVSTGHPDITAGTIGCRVKDSSGNVYALSNNHIYANCNDASIGDNELQPGPTDGGQDPEDAIGTLYDYEQILYDGSSNYIDAAIAATTTAYVGTATPEGDGYGTPNSSTKSASLGMKVQKYGRTTGWTHGEVSELNVTVEVCYEARGPFNCVKSAVFVDQIAITPGTFSDGGDSGSLIVTDDSNANPVALLFAGSSENTLANPINLVLNRFNVTVDDATSGTTNYPPTADFTYTTSDLTADFSDQSTDSDGSIASWSWDFGDGATSTSQNPSHTYASDGTYTVTLTVTDDDGAIDSVSKDVSVSSGSSSGITLTATGYKVRGRKTTDLEWSGATGTDVEIYRDGVLLTVTENDGFYTDATGSVGGGSYTYQVCEIGGSPCSNEATVTF